MDNYMDLEKRPSQLRPSSEKESKAPVSSSIDPPALQLKVSQFEGLPEEEELQMKKVAQFEGVPEEEELQMKKEGSAIQRQEEGGSGASGPSSLPESLVNSASEHFGSDFSDVQVHTDSQKAGDLGALAYTQGKDIHFAPNTYDPASSTGKSLIGHELTHVVQQSEGRVQATGEIDGMPLNDDHSLEREADDMGSRFAK
ncbi:MAG: DUF4157 domain-containing protein [Saprospirales bacterium]|nr:DUF4157 domain-containing protein [Saprospirales bacterium]